jgi:hypothetical protein
LDHEARTCLSHPSTLKAIYKIKSLGCENNPLKRKFLLQKKSLYTSRSFKAIQKVLLSFHLGTQPNFSIFYDSSIRSNAINSERLTSFSVEDIQDTNEIHIGKLLGKN